MWRARRHLTERKDGRQMQVQDQKSEVALVSEVSEAVVETPDWEQRPSWLLDRIRKLAFRKVKQHFSKLPYVWNGHLINWRESPSYRLHWYADGAAFLLGAVFQIPLDGWLWLSLACVLKAGVEALNTSHEKHAEYEWPRRQVGSNKVQNNRTAKEIKDSAAFAVGTTVVFSLVVWAVVFIPELWRLVT